MISPNGLINISPPKAVISSVFLLLKSLHLLSIQYYNLSDFEFHCQRDLHNHYLKFSSRSVVRPRHGNLQAKIMASTTAVMFVQLLFCFSSKYSSLTSAIKFHNLQFKIIIFACTVYDVEHLIS